MNCTQKISTYFEKKLYFWVGKSSILPHFAEIGSEEMQHLMSTGQDLYSTIEEGEIEFLGSILTNCIKKGQISDCDVKKTSEFIFALADGVKDKHMKFNRNRFSPQAKLEDIVKDINSSINIFMKGLQ